MTFHHESRFPNLLDAEPTFWKKLLRWIYLSWGPGKVT